VKITKKNLSVHTKETALKRLKTESHHLNDDESMTSLSNSHRIKKSKTVARPAVSAKETEEEQAPQGGKINTRQLPERMIGPISESVRLEKVRRYLEKK